MLRAHAAEGTPHRRSVGWHRPDAELRAQTEGHGMSEQGQPPAEASFYDDPTTADLGAKVAEAWSEFGRALAAALPELAAGTRLDLTLDPSAAGVGDAVF